MTIKKIVIFVLLAVVSANAPAFDSYTDALPFNSYTIWVDGVKVSIADVRAEVDNMRKGKIDKLDLLLKERVIRQLNFVYSQSEQMELFQEVMQFLSNHSPNPEVEEIYKSRRNYFLKMDNAYPKNIESCVIAREVYERSCIELISVLYKSRHLGEGEKMLRIRDLLDNNFEVYPLQADLWRLMLSVSVRDHLSVAISDESVGRLLAINDENTGDLFYQVLGAVNSLCKLIDDGSDSYKKCDHYTLWIKFRDIYSGKEARQGWPMRGGRPESEGVRPKN